MNYQELHFGDWTIYYSEQLCCYQLNEKEFLFTTTFKNRIIVNLKYQDGLNWSLDGMSSIKVPQNMKVAYLDLLD
ncbi:Uncharacterised protein [Chlamydia trachomatis]|nr:Uncharacterised protein [Chlamydia trachomatis]